MNPRFCAWSFLIVISLVGSIQCSTAKGESFVVAWGQNTFGQTNVPADATNIVGVAASSRYSVILRNDGTVFGWGFLNYSLASISNAVAISAGLGHTLALKADGTVHVAGSTFTITNSPADLTNAVAIACGANHSLVLRSDGTVSAWGQPSAATNTPPGLSNVVAISASGNYNFALKDDGTFVGWGVASWQGPTYPTNLTSLAGISGSLNHGIALKQDGSVVAWDNPAGSDFALGLDNVINVTSFDGGLWAIRRSGTLAGWGENLGQTNVWMELTNVLAISSGTFHHLAIVGDGSPDPQHIISNYGFVAGVFSIAQQTIRGRSYVLESKNNFDENSWRIFPPKFGDDNIHLLKDSAPAPDHKFYQLRLSR